MIDYNLHQHTLFSDGKEAPIKYVEKAIELGMSSVGFSEHSPLPFDNPFSLKKENVSKYIETIDELKKTYKGQVNVYRALEMDFIPGLSQNFDYWRKTCQTDYLIGSVHLVKPDDKEDLWFTDGPDYRVYDEGINNLFDGDVKKAVAAFFHQTNRMIETQGFEILGHFDKVKMHNRGRYFTEDEHWYRNLINETIDLVREKNLIVEINTRGLYKKRSDALFPDGYALKRVKEAGIPVIISSDAHHSSEIGLLLNKTATYLNDLGFNELMFLQNGNWESRPITG